MNKIIKPIIIAAICIYFSFINILTSNGDVIYLKGLNDGIHVKSSEMGTDSISAPIPKESISSVTLSFNGHGDYTDMILLNNKAKVPCKIVEMRENTIVAKFPRNLIKSLQLEFSENGEEVFKTPKIQSQPHNKRIEREAVYYNEETDDSYSGEYEKMSSEDEPLDLIMLEDELEEDAPVRKSARKPTARDDIKRELLSEIQQNKSNKKPQKQWPSEKSAESSSDLLEQTLGKYEEPSNKNSYEETSQKTDSDWEDDSDFQNSSFGRVKGRFLQKGKPLPSCKVRVIKLRKEGLVYYKDTENGKSIESTTDRYGIYLFEDVPPGLYKLYWKPPMETSWIRRVSMEPDVLVKIGEIAYLDDVETNQKILN